MNKTFENVKAKSTAERNYDAEKDYIIEVRNLNFEYSRSDDSSDEDNTSRAKELSASGETSKSKLKNINLSIKAGECIVLCGKSGCGKSSLIRLFNGMIPSFYEGEISGDLFFEKKRLTEMSMYEIAKSIGTVFQNPRTQFYTVNTTSEIAFGLENMGLPREEIKKRVERTAKDLDIENLMNRSIFELSGGEKQIIAFASIYAMNPDVYLLDEPSANLDFFAINKIKRILKLLKKAGKTIIIAEHRIFYLAEIFDRAIYMKDGEINREYSREDLKNMSKEEHIKTGIRMLDLGKVELENTENLLNKKDMYLTYLSGYYGKRKAIEIDHLKISSGKIYGIIGHNGAGKSTFLSTLSGIIKKSEGYSLIESKVISKRQRLKESYIVMQEVNHQLFMDSVKEEVVASAYKRDKSEEDFKNLMDHLDLAGLEERHPMTLSGGQKQRVIIASAKYSNKKILLFDEPTSGLDYYHMYKTASLIKELSKEDCYILIVTHDYEFIANVCDSIIRIEKGALKENYELDGNGFDKLKAFFGVA